MNFLALLNTINQTHTVFQEHAVKAINTTLTLRNWLIGYYIFEFEQNGEDRAQYGASLLQNLSAKLNEQSLSYRNLKLFRQFYKEYPQIGQTLSAQLPKYAFIPEISIGQSLSAQSGNTPTLPPEKLLNNLSFSHMVELMKIAEPLKRTFYEVECINGCWGTRELKNQINRLYFERSGLSQSPEKLQELTNSKAIQLKPNEIVKSVYAFEFLGLKAKEAIEENDLESALIDHLQEFMLEIGHGFCFEARQKKILIGGEHYFIDLVFYHRILKCHVLIELKVDQFNHENIGQLNTYVSFYKKMMMQSDDNPPIGILLVTNKNNPLVEFATAGMDNNLFVSKYLLELPEKKQLEQFIKDEIEKWQ